MENCRSRLFPWLPYNLGPRVTILNLFSTSEKESSKKNLRSMSLIIHDFNYPISDIRNKLLAEVFLAPNSVKRENRWQIPHSKILRVQKKQMRVRRELCLLKGSRKLRQVSKGLSWGRGEVCFLEERQSFWKRYQLPFMPITHFFNNKKLRSGLRLSTVFIAFGDFDFSRFLNSFLTVS